MTTKLSTKQKILNQIIKFDGVTSIGLVAADLSIACETVRKYVKVLIAEKVVEFGWDGQALTLTLAAQRESQEARPLDRLVDRLTASAAKIIPCTR